MRHELPSPPPVQRSTRRRRGFGLGLVGFLLLGVFGVSGPSIAHANLDDGGGYCPPEFDRCDGTGWHDCYDYGPCGGGGGDGGGGGGGGWGPPAEWVARSHSGSPYRMWSSAPNIVPSSDCNTGWHDLTTLDAWIRSMVEGTINRNWQRRQVCTRVPREDYCNRWFCYATDPYAWEVRNDLRWEELV